MMDDVMHKLGIDPVEFTMKNMRSLGRASPSPTTLSTNASAAAPSCSIGKRWRPVPGSDRGPVKRGAGMSMMQFRAGQGRSSAVLRVDAKARYTLFVGVTDVGGGAKTTMGMIAAEELGVPLSQVEVVWGDTDRCPYSVSESGSRTTIMTGYAVVQAARGLKTQIADKGMPTGTNVLVASVDPNRTPTANSQLLRRALCRGRCRYAARHGARHQTSRFTSRGAS